MGVEITIALSKVDIGTVWELKEISTLNVRAFAKDAKDGLTEDEMTEYGKWLWREDLFNRMESLIDNEILKTELHNEQGGDGTTVKMISNINVQTKITSYEDIERLKKLCDELSQALNSPKVTARKQGMYSDNEFLSLSGKELKELVNKWIVHHVENDINLSPGYFERLLRGWETIYRRQCGMSMLNRDLDYAKMLMPINIYKNVLIQDGQIEVADHIYKKDGIERYNQQEMNVYELEDKFIVYDCDGLYITSINK